MGKHTTVVSCASLSFDMTFFALVRIWICGQSGKIVSRRCAAHPTKRRPMMADNEALEYSAYVSAFMTYHKIIDDINDERGVRRLFARIALIFAKGPVKKIPRELSPVGEKIRECLRKLSEIEKSKCENPSEPADVFGELLGYAISFGLDGDSARIADEIGRKVGRWVYLADAACDIDKDKKSGSYNPFICAMGAEGARKFVENELDGVLSMELLSALGAFELGPDRKDECTGCIRNIITKGMRHTLAERLTGGKEKKRERSV